MITTLLVAMLNCSAYENYQNLCPPLSLEIEPRDQTLQNGAKASFLARTLSGGDYQFQWYFQSTTIEGATNAVLTLKNVSAAQSGYYSVVVRDFDGNFASDVASLEVKPGLSVFKTNETWSIKITGEPGYHYTIEQKDKFAKNTSWQAITNLASITLTNHIETLPLRTFTRTGFYRLREDRPNCVP